MVSRKKKKKQNKIKGKNLLNELGLRDVYVQLTSAENFPSSRKSNEEEHSYIVPPIIEEDLNQEEEKSNLERYLEGKHGDKSWTNYMHEELGMEWRELNDLIKNEEEIVDGKRIQSSGVTEKEIRERLEDAFIDSDKIDKAIENAKENFEEVLKNRPEEFFKSPFVSKTTKEAWKELQKSKTKEETQPEESPKDKELLSEEEIAEKIKEKELNQEMSNEEDRLFGILEEMDQIEKGKLKEEDSDLTEEDFEFALDSLDEHKNKKFSDTFYSQLNNQFSLGLGRTTEFLNKKREEISMKLPYKVPPLSEEEIDAIEDRFPEVKNQSKEPRPEQPKEEHDLGESISGILKRDQAPPQPEIIQPEQPQEEKSEEPQPNASELNLNDLEDGKDDGEASKLSLDNVEKDLEEGNEEDEKELSLDDLDLDGLENEDIILNQEDVDPNRESDSSISPEEQAKIDKELNNPNLEEFKEPDFSKPTEELENDISEKIKNWPLEKKEKLGGGLVDISFAASQYSNRLLKKSLGSAARQPWMSDFLSSRLHAMEDIFAKRENTARKNREETNKGLLKKAGGVFIIPSALARFGRIFYGYNFANPIRIAMAASMTAGFMSETEKGARLKKIELIEKTQIHNIEEAQDEAWAIYELATKKSENKEKEPSAEDIKQAYLTTRLEDINSRLLAKDSYENSPFKEFIKSNKDKNKIYREIQRKIKIEQRKLKELNKLTDIPEEERKEKEEEIKNNLSSFIERRRDAQNFGIFYNLAQRKITDFIEKLNQQAEKIKNGKGSPEEIETKLNVLWKKNEEFLHDADRMISNMGIVDSTSYYLRRSEIWSKRLTNALVVETIGEGIYNIYDYFTKASEAIESTPAETKGVWSKFKSLFGFGEDKDISDTSSNNLNNDAKLNDSESVLNQESIKDKSLIEPKVESEINSIDTPQESRVINDPNFTPEKIEEMTDSVKKSYLEIAKKEIQSLNERQDFIEKVASSTPEELSNSGISFEKQPDGSLTITQEAGTSGRVGYIHVETKGVNPDFNKEQEQISRLKEAFEKRSEDLSQSLYNGGGEMSSSSSRADHAENLLAGEEDSSSASKSISEVTKEIKTPNRGVTSPDISEGPNDSSGNESIDEVSKEEGVEESSRDVSSETKSSSSNISEKSDYIAGVDDEMKMAEKITPPSPETSEIFTPKESLEYQGGRSVWKEAEKQLQGRFEELFNNLGESDPQSAEALKTYNIDRLKDVVLSDPEKYGLPTNPDFRRMSSEMISNIKWDDAFKDAFPKGILTDKLSPEAIENIVKNNQSLRETAHAVKESVQAPKPSIFTPENTPSAPVVEKVEEVVEKTKDVEPPTPSKEYSHDTLIHDRNEKFVPQHDTLIDDSVGSVPENPSEPLISERPEEESISRGIDKNDEIIKAPPPEEGHKPLIQDLMGDKEPPQPPENIPVIDLDELENSNIEKHGVIDIISTKEEAIDTLKEKGLHITNEKDFIKDLGLNRAKSEEVEKALISLAYLDINSVSEAKTILEVSSQAQLPIETISEHMDFALNEELSPQTSAKIIRLLNDPDNALTKNFFIEKSSPLKVTSSEQFIDTHGKTGENLKLFFSSSNKKIPNFEMRIWKDGFLIEGYGVKHSLKDLEKFLKYPTRYLSSLLAKK